MPGETLELRTRMIRQALYGFTFLCTWLACIALGYVIPMMTYDHGDVVSAFMVMIYVPIAAFVGLLPATLVVYAISRSDRAPQGREDSQEPKR